MRVSGRCVTGEARGALASTRCGGRDSNTVDEERNTLSGGKVRGADSKNRVFPQLTARMGNLGRFV